MAEASANVSFHDGIWSGGSRTPMYNKDVSAGRIIFTTMRTWPKNVCQINELDDSEVTFGQALTWAIRIAQFFKKKGLDHKNVIGVSMKNSTYSIPLGAACLMNATPFHSVSTLLDEATTKHVFSITKPSVVFCDGSDIKKIQSATAEWQPDIFTLTDHVQGVPSIETLLEPTGTEMLYHGLDWMTGLMTFMFTTVLGSTRLISSTPFNPEHFAKIVEKYKINVTVLAPRHLSALASYPDAPILPNIRHIHHTGGWVSEATLQKIQKMCPNVLLTSGYGMTEMGVVTANRGLGHITSAGTPVPGVRMRIVNEEGKNLTYNEVGEIFVHTGHKWNGYYGNELETRNLQDSEGWYHTGDLGYFDQDNYLHIVDRKKEMLRYESLSYFPNEIESVISQLPEVQDVCVVGIYDERVGDEAGALVVRTPGAEISAQDIVDHVAKHHSKTIERQLHAGVQFTQKLPSNANGKTLRKAAREEFAAKKKAGS